jgi:hypothetical protein
MARHSPLTKAAVSLALLAGFFALLVAAANPVAAAVFVRRQGLCLPGTDVCLRPSAC